MTMKRFTFLILLLILIASSTLDAYYDPHIGRFTQRDPAGDGVNWYAYAANNPMKFVDPTGMYIVLPGGTEIRSVPDQVDGSYVKPDGLSSDSVLVWDSIFTGGINGTGIAGSNTGGGILADIINSDTRVEIQFAEYISGNALGDAKDWGPLAIVQLDTELKPSNPQRTIVLLHEFSHVHDFMTMPSDYVNNNPYHAIYVTELKAFHLEARYAREMDRLKGNYVFGSYSKAAAFTEYQLTHYHSTVFYRALNRLARPPGLPYY